MKDYTIHPLFNRPKPAEDENHQSSWKFLAVIPAVLTIVFFWSQISGILSDLDKIAPTELLTAPVEKEVAAETPREASSDEVLSHALRSERQGDRQIANLAFQDLLRQVALPASAQSDRSGSWRKLL
ncbi:MAG: hypothetical protein GY815_06040 [Gammaproteobacteria bacterium]|nr:hypothetical protein [Gammaproteobacteria bacterium]